jgi:hypothetical protein
VRLPYVLIALEALAPGGPQAGNVSCICMVALPQVPPPISEAPPAAPVLSPGYGPAHARPSFPALKYHTINFWLRVSGAMI